MQKWISPAGELSIKSPITQNALRLHRGAAPRRLPADMHHRGRLLLLLLPLALLSSLGADATPPVSQSAALRAIFSSTGGFVRAWTRAGGWGSGTGDACSWDGVSCDGAGANVIALDLRANGLVGTIPDVALAALGALQTLRLSGNVVALSLPVACHSAFSRRLYAHFL